MKTVTMTVYKSETYEIVLMDDDVELAKADPDWLYKLACDNGYEPDDFGVNEITVEVL